MRRNGLLVTGLLAYGLIAAGTAAAATENAETTPSFTKDVAPIVFKYCATCHRPGEVAPMSLLSYQDARPWARAMKEKVVAREMPPWFADERWGEFRNDRSLSQEQIDTIVAWVDAGAPKGDDADLPPVPAYAEGWMRGTDPDLVIAAPEVLIPGAAGEFATPGGDFYIPIPVTEDKFAEVIESRPGNLAVTHHVLVNIGDLPRGTKLDDRNQLRWADTGTYVSGESRAAREDGSDEAQRVFQRGAITKLIAWTPGKGLQAYRPGQAKRIPAGKHFIFNLHYQPTGVDETDVSKLGLWLSKEPPSHEVHQQRVGVTHLVEGEELLGTVREVRGREVAAGGRIPNIPPHAGNWRITGITPFGDDITLLALTPHMHLRGQSTTYVVTYPDGSEEVLLSVPRYDFNWQIFYELVEPKKIPAGSKLTAIGTFDNSIKNRWNPAPHMPVYWAEQSWDEMFNSFYEFTVDKQDLRQAKPSTEE